MLKSSLMTLGKIVKPHGLQGELCVTHYTDSPFLFEDLQRLFLRLPGGRPRRYTVTGVRYNRDRPLISFREIQGRDQAERLRGAEVLARRRDLPDEDPEAFMIADLQGLQIYRDDGLFLGDLREVQSHAGQEIWVIAHPEGNEILFPAVDPFVLEIDLQAGLARIDPPPGLLDLYLPGMKLPK